MFEHDLRANAFRVCREGKPVSTFPDRALSLRTAGHADARPTTGSEQSIVPQAETWIVRRSAPLRKRFAFVAGNDVEGVAIGRLTPPSPWRGCPKPCRGSRWWTSSAGRRRPGAPGP